MRFEPAPEYQVFPTREQPLKPYEAAVRAAGVTREFVRSFDPEAVVADILTVAPALAAELEGVPVATLVPHVPPDLAPGFPPFSIGARRPRTRTARGRVARGGPVGRAHVLHARRGGGGGAGGGRRLALPVALEAALVAEKGLLDDVLGAADAAEHPVGEREQQRT